MVDLSQIAWLGTMIVAFLVVAGFYYTVIRKSGGFVKWLRSDTQ